MKINEIRPQDNEYTKVLQTIALTPKLLYYYGEWPKERIKSVAIVGARKNTRYGEEVAFNLAKALAEKGIIVVSGLAYGIDSIAARGALAGGGKTIAILGTIIERIYPAEHTKLAEEIVAKGGVVASEYHFGDELYDHKSSFLQRNRIISGLADAVVVVEAREKSGSLNTASHAIAQGKDLFAVPGDINRQTSQGCNRLILNGANPYLGVEDFIKYLFPTAKSRSKKARQDQISLFADTQEEKDILTLLSAEVRDGDEILDRLGMDIVTFNQTITMLEIKGAVKSLGANYWTLA
ncbi:DNA-processing protein DprA [Candidatus Saccharibacteria bacterium]|nr:DNA-processing protein DprA [Candidatus Saccharibacteria bacterium]